MRAVGPAAASKRSWAAFGMVWNAARVPCCPHGALGLAQVLGDLAEGL